MNATTQALKYYSISDFLTKEIIDIPVIVKYSQLELYAGYLLSINYLYHSADVKIAMGNFPRPPIISYSKKIAENGLTFEYCTVNLSQISLLQDLVQEDMMPQYGDQPIPASSFLAQYVDKYQAEYAQFCYNELLYKQSLNCIEFIEDYQGKNIEKLQLFKSRIIIRQIGQKIIVEETKIKNVLAQQLIKNRKFICNIGVAFPILLSNTQTKCSVTLSKIGARLSQLYNPQYTHQINEWYNDYVGLFKGVLQYFFQNKNFSQNIIAFVQGQLECDCLSDTIRAYGQKTISNVQMIQQRYDNKVNANQINYNILLLLLFFQEAVPLSCIIQTSILHQKLEDGTESSGNSMQQLFNLLKQIITESYYGFKDPNLFSSCTEINHPVDFDLNLSNVLPGIEIVEKNNIFDPYCYRIDVQQIENNCQQIIDAKQVEYSIVMSVFSNLSFDYYEDFNYITLQSNEKFALINLCTNEKSVIKIQNSQYNVIVQQLVKLRSHDEKEEVVNSNLNDIQALQQSLLAEYDQFTNIIQLKREEVTLLKVNKEASTLTQLTNEYSPRNQNSLFKKISEIENSILLKLDSRNSLINYQFFEAFIQGIVHIQEQLKIIQKQQYYCGLIQFEFTSLIKQSLEELNTILITLTNSLLKILNQLSSDLQQEILYFRNCYYTFVINPQYFKIAMEMQRFFTAEKQLRIYNNIYDIFNQNGQLILQKFPHLMQDEQKYSKFTQITFQNLQRSQKQWILFTKQLRLKVMNYQQQQNEILTIINLIDSYICQQCIKSYNILKDYLVASSYSEMTEIAKKFSNIKLDEFAFPYAGNEEILKAVLQTFAKASKIRYQNSNSSISESLYQALKDCKTVTQDLLLRQQQQYDSSFDIEQTSQTLSSQLCYWQASLFELCNMSQCSFKWRSWLLESSEMASLADYSAIGKFPSPSSVILAFAPVIQITQNYAYITSIMQQQQLIRDYPAEVIIQQYEKTHKIMKLLRERVSEGKYTLTTIQHAYFKQGMKTQSKQQVVQQFNYESIEYSRFIIIADKLIDELELLYQKNCFVYFIQDPLFDEKHFYTFARLMNITIDKKLNQDVHGLFDLCEKRHDIVDYLLLLRQNVRLDYYANAQLKQLHNSLAGIFIQTTFLNSTRSEKKLVNIIENKKSIAVDISKLYMLMINPIQWDNICSEALQSCSKIIGNQGFLGQRSTNCEKDYDVNFELMYFQIIDNIQRSSQDREQKKLLKQWRYSVDVEGKARDIEAIAQVLRLVLNQLKTLPVMLYDLLSIYNNNYIAVHKEQSLSKYLNLFSKVQESLLATLLYQWNHFIEKYILTEQEVSVITMVYDEQCCQEITILFSKVQQFYQQFFNNPYQQQIQNNYNRIIDNKIEQQQLSPQQQRLATIVPHIFLNGEVIINSKALLLQAPPFVYFSKFSLHEVDTLNLPLLYKGFESLLVNAQEIVGIKFKTYEVTFQKSIAYPQFSYQIVDIVDKALYLSIRDNSLSCFDKISSLLASPPTNQQFVLPSGQNTYSQLDCVKVQDIFSQYQQQHIFLAISTFGYIQLQQIIYLFKCKQHHNLTKQLLAKLQYLQKLTPQQYYEIQNLLQQFLQLLQSIFKSDDFQSWLSARDYNFAIQYIDQESLFIQTSDLFNNYTIIQDIGYYNTNSQFAAYYYEIVNKIFFGLSQNVPIILNSVQQYKENLVVMKQIEELLQYLTKQRVFNVVVSNSNFDEQLCQIEKYIITGCLVIVVNFEVLDSSNSQQVHLMLQNIKHKQGQFKYHFISRKQDPFSGQGSLEQKEFKIMPLQYSNIQKLGNLLFYVCGLEFKQDAEHFQYNNIDGVDTQNIALLTRKKMEQVQSQSIYIQKVKQSIQQLQQSFQQVVIVNQQIDDFVYYYKKHNQLFGAAFFELQQSISIYGLDVFHPSLDDFIIVNEEVQDQSNAMGLSYLLCDYINRFSHYFGDYSIRPQQVCRIIAYNIAAAFGLDQSQTINLMNFANNFAIIQQNASQETANDEVIVQYVNTLKEHIKKPLLLKVEVTQKLFELPLIFSLDLMFIHNYLQNGNTLIIKSNDNITFKQIITYYQLINSVKVYYIYDSQDLQFQLMQAAIKQRRACFAIVPTNQNSILKICDVIEQNVQNMQYLQIIIGISNASNINVFDVNIRQCISHVIEISEHKSNSPDEKYSALRQLRINKYHYAKIAPFKLQHLWNEKKLANYTFEEIVQQFNCSCMITSPLQRKYYYQYENRLQTLSPFVTGCYAYIYDILCDSFPCKFKYEDHIIIRNLILLLLYKHKIIEPVKQQIQNQYLNQLFSKKAYYDFQDYQRLLNSQENSCGNDPIQRFLISQFLKQESNDYQYQNNVGDNYSIQRNLILQYLYPIQQISGMPLKKLQLMQQQFEKAFKNGKNLDSSTENIIKQQLQDNEQYFGLGQSGSLQYQFMEQFIFDYYLSPDSNFEAFSNIGLTLLSQIINAFIIYYQNVKIQPQNNTQKGNWTSKLAMIYQKVLQSIRNLDSFGQKIKTVFHPISVLLAYDDIEHYPEVNIEARSVLLIKNGCSVYQIFSGINNVQQQALYQQLFREIAGTMPQQFQQYGYIHIVQQQAKLQLEFEDFQIGKGIFNNLTMQTEKQLIEQYISSNINNIVNQRLQQQSSYNYQQISDAISIQSMSSNTLLIDNYRAQFILFLSGCLLSSTTVSLIGIEGIGKSILLNISKLFIRELIDSSFVHLNDQNVHFNQQYTSKYVTQSILQKYILRSYPICCQEIAQKQKLQNINQQSQPYDWQQEENSILYYYQSQAFPVYHLNIQSNNQQFDDGLIAFLRDHSIKFNQNITVDNMQQRFYGYSSLSDCSIIIENRYLNDINQYSEIVVQTPIINQVYLQKLLELQYPQHDKRYIDQFVNGYFLLTNSFDLDMLNNFTLWQILSSYSEPRKIENQKLKEPTITSSFTEDSAIKVLYNQEYSINDILMKDDDKQLGQLNVISLFSALNEKLQYHNVLALQERLSSLDILGYLKDDVVDGVVQDNPWKYTNLIIGLQFNITPAWKAQIFNMTLHSLQLHQTFSYSASISGPVLQLDIQSSGLGAIHKILPQELLINVGYYSVNQQILQNCLYVYQSQIQRIRYPNPLLYQQIITVVIDLLVAKQRNNNKLSLYLQYGIENHSRLSLSGILAECQTINQRKALIKAINRFPFSILGSLNGEQSVDALFCRALQEEAELLSAQIASADEASENMPFGGLPLVSSFELIVSYQTLRCGYLSSNAYGEMLEFVCLATAAADSRAHHPILKLPIAKEDASESEMSLGRSSSSSMLSATSTEVSRSSIQSRMLKRYQSQQQKITEQAFLYDLRSISDGLLLDPVQETKQQGFDIIHYVRGVMNNYRKANSYNEQQLDSIQTIIILRVLIGLSVGIKPDVIVSQQYNNATPELVDGVRIASQLTSIFPSKLIPNGRFLASLPIACSNWNEMTQKYVQRKKHIKRSKNSLLDSMIIYPQPIILVVDSYYLNQDISDGVTIGQLFKRIFQPTNLLYSLFTIEELEAISMIVSYNFQVESIIDYKMISQFFATNLQIIEVDTYPLSYQQQCMANSIQAPIIQYSSKRNCLCNDNYKEIFINNLSNQKVIQNVVTKAALLRNRNLQYNVVSGRLNCFSNLYKISNCRYPQIPTYYNTVVPQEQSQDLVEVSLTLYKELVKYSMLPSICFQKFISICVSLYEFVLQKLITIDTSCYNVANLLQFYEQLCQPSNQQFRQLKISSLSMGYFQSIINRMIDNIYDQSQKEGIILNTEQQLLQVSIAETIMLRDAFKSISNEVENEMLKQKDNIKSLAFDIPCLVALLAFGLNDQLNYQQFDSAIAQGQYGNISAHLMRVRNNIGSHFNQFNYYLMVILEASNYKIRHIEESYEDRLIVERSSENYCVLASNSNYGGKYMFVSNVLMLLTPDWPILPLLEYFKYEWRMGDPYYSYLQIALLYHLVGYSTFFIDNSMAICIGLAIASQIHHIASINIVTNMVDSKEQKADYQGLITKLLAYVEIVDLTQPFGHTLQQIRLGINTNKVIVFNNFDSSNTNFKAIMMIRKLLALKNNDNMNNARQFSLGPIKCESLVPLKQLPIVIGYDENADYISVLQKYNIYDSQLINNCAILKIKKYEYREQQAMQIYNGFITELFGYSYTNRYYCEQIIISKIQTQIKLSQVNQLLASYYKQYISPMLSRKNVKFDALTFRVNQNLSKEQAIEISKMLSCFTNQNKKQQVMLDTFLKAVKNYSRQQQAIAILMDVHQNIDEVNYQFELQCLSRQYIKKYIESIIIRICKALTMWLEEVKSLSIICTPLQTLTGQNIKQLIYEKIREDVKGLTRDSIQQLQSYKRELSISEQKKYDVKLFIDEYPLFFYIKENQQKFQYFLLKIVFSSIMQKSVLLLPADMVPGFWMFTFSFIYGYNGCLSNGDQDNYHAMLSTGALFCDKIDDKAKQIACQQLFLSFEGSNIFSINKMFSKKYIQNNFQEFNSISQLIPDVCKLSPKLQYSWILLQSGAKYSKLISNSLQYFVKNTSVFVNLSKAQSPLLSILRGFSVKYPDWIAETFSQSEEHKWLFDKLFKGEYSAQVQAPIQGFKLNDLQTYYTSFIISSLLEPQNLINDIESFACLASNWTGSSPLQLIKQSSPRPEYRIAGISNHSAVQLNDVVDKYSSIIQQFSSLMGLGIEKASQFLDPAFFQLVLLVLQLRNSGAASPIAVVYVSSYFNIQHLIATAQQIVEKLACVRCIVANEYIEEDVVQFIILEPLQAKKQLDHLTARLSGVLQKPMHPCVLVAKSCQFSGDCLDCYSSYLPQPLISQYNGAMGALFERVKTEYCSIARPHSPRTTFVHLLNILALKCHQYHSKHLGQLFSTQALLQLLVYYSLQCPSLKSDTQFYELFTQLSMHGCKLPKYYFDIRQQIPEEVIQKISGIQLNFDNTLCEIIDQSLNLTDILPEKLYIMTQKEISSDAQALEESEQQSESEYASEEFSDSLVGQQDEEKSQSSQLSSSFNSSFDSSQPAQSNDATDNSITFTQNQNTRQKKLVFKEQNQLTSFILQLNVISNPQYLLNSLNIKQFLKSIKNIIAPTQRTLSTQQLNKGWIINSEINSFQSIMNKFDIMENELNDSSNLLNRCFSSRIFQLPLIENVTRRLFSNSLLRNSVQQLQYNQQLNYQIHIPALCRQLPSDFSTFIKLLNVSNSPVFTSSLPDFEIVNGFTKLFTCSVPSQQQIFSQQINTWNVDGSATIQILGNILHFLKIIFSLQHQIPLQIVSVCGFFKQPQKQLFINQQCQFQQIGDQFLTCKVDNLQLFNAVYDAQKEELVSLSDIQNRGVSESFSLYFICFSYDQPEMQQQQVIPEGYLAVPVRCGGIIEPLVLVENKSGIRPDEFNYMNVRIGAQLI